MSAAKELQEAGYGSLVVLSAISQNAHMFVKKTPSEISALLHINADLCSYDEYFTQYGLPSFTYITDKMQTIMVQMGLVQAEDFKLRYYAEKRSVAQNPQV